MTEIVFADNTPQEMRDEVLRLAKQWKPGRRKLVRGVGINDADYRTTATTTQGSWMCPLYSLWVSILGRAYSDSFHIQCPTYKNCNVDRRWWTFMNFRNWCLENGWISGYHLDKDFISDSKVYGPDTCAFIPQRVNVFITDREALRGDYPIGVSKWDGKYQSSCRNPFTKKGERLGYFNTPEEAHSAWKQKKHEHALALADMYPDLDHRVLHALRTKYLN